MISLSHAASLRTDDFAGKGPASHGCFESSFPGDGPAFFVRWTGDSLAYAVQTNVFEVVTAKAERVFENQGKSLKVGFDGTNRFILESLQGAVLVDCELGVGVEIHLSQGEAVVVERGMAVLQGGNLGSTTIKSGRGGAVCLRFRDGARVALKGEGVLRLDPFQEGAFVLSGLGQTEMRGADGAPRLLGEEHAPYAGGLLEAGAKGGFARKLAWTEVELIFEDGSAVRWTDGKQRGVVGDGARIQGVLGTLVEFKPLVGGGVKVQVTKGLVRLGVQGLPGWSAVGLTGHELDVRVDRGSRVIDLTAYGQWDRPRLLLPGRHVLSMSNGSLVQYQQFDPVSSEDFLLSAMGGDAVVLNLGSMVASRVRGENRLFRVETLRNEPVAAGVIPGVPIVKLNWQGSGVDLEGSLGTARTSMGNPVVLRGSKGQELQATQSSLTEVFLEARSGDFVLEPRQAPGLLVNLSEGNSVLLTHPRTGAIVVRSDERNVKDTGLNLSGAGPAFPPLKPGGTFTFISGGVGQELGGAGGNTIFTEAAGAGPGGAATAPLHVPFTSGPFNQPTSLDVTRLPQTSASGVGTE